MAARSRDDALLLHLDATPPAWVITASRRLARSMRLRVAELRAAQGRRVSETPSIHSLEDWLVETGREVLASEAAREPSSATHGRVLLSPAAEQLLWERVIAAASEDLPRQLLDTSALAFTASEAWKRVCLWGEPSWTGALVEDVEAFRSWLPLFRARLQSGGFVTTAELPALAADAIAGGYLEALPPALLVLGFERRDPAIERVVAAFEQRGTTVLRELETEARPPATLRSWRATTPSAEIRAVAADIRERLLAEPQLRIGVLAPELAACGDRLERIFEEELDPAGLLSCGESARRFDYAEAPALGDYPMIANALDLLSIGGRRLHFDTASRVLLSEFPRSEDDSARHRELRGRTEARLRRERTAVLHLAGRRGSLAAALRREGLVAASERYEALHQYLLKQGGTRRSPSAWRSEWGRRLAKVLGWPGPLHGDSEGQVYSAWRDAMEDFAQLEAVEALMTETEALERLRAICDSMRVQPSSSGLSVQVMNLLDAAGLQFDVIYAIGMTSTAFPAPPRPNPLLPVAWQRAQQGMPRASVEGERALAEMVWARVLASAREVHASYACAGDSEEEHSPSSFLAALPGSGEPRDAHPWWLGSAMVAPREPRPADPALPPIVRKGGSSILTWQSDCSFRAFVAQRLGAERLAGIEPQPNSALRGTLVHEALALAYTDIPSSSDLAGLGDENIEEVAARAADQAVAAISERTDFFTDAADLANATRLWLRELVASWMRYERAERPGEWSVESREVDLAYTFPSSADDPLTIRFRPDRIDRVEDGGIVVLDFKTGTPKTAARWNGDRPEEPQLLLYLALLAEQGHRVDGIAFANLAARNSCDLIGAGARDFAAHFRPPGRTKIRTTADYQAAVERWRGVVEALALGYLRGELHADPRKPQVCKRCGGQALCRIREGGAVEETDAGSE